MSFFKFYLKKNKIFSVNIKDKSCNSLVGLQLFKKRLQHRCFPVNTPKGLGTAFFIEQLCWLLSN